MDDPKESASSDTEMPEGTPTGRLKSDDLMDFMERWMGIRPPTYLREPMAALENSPEIPLLVGADFSELEARTVAILVGHRGGKLHMKEILEGDFYQGLKPNLVIIDEVSQYPDDGFHIIDSLTSLMNILPEWAPPMKIVKDWSAPIPDLRLPDKKTKQNGRDASYLDLDPTKRHGKRRR